MINSKPAVARVYGLAIKQERGKVTYDALIDTGFQMLEQRDLQDISIADLAKEAGYSVGAFYARFRSKDEFFEALLARHLHIRTEAQQQMFAGLPLESLVADMVSNVVNYYWEHRKFWCAVLVRSHRDQEFWETICIHGYEFARRFIGRMEMETGRELNEREKTSVTFAFQTMLCTINCTIINHPGPQSSGQENFVEELTRAFRLIAGFDELQAEALVNRSSSHVPEASPAGASIHNIKA